MQKDNFTTPVIFRKFKDGDIIALFTEGNTYNSYVLSYMHNGQHSDADYSGIICTTKPAKESEYISLYQELESIGYNLKVVQKRMKR